MRTHLCARLAGPLVVALALGAGCSLTDAVQDEQSCPGDDCPPELSQLGDDVAALPGVTDVERTAWFSGLDNGVSGRVEVVATGVDRAEAAEIAASIVDLYVESDIEEPAVIDVEIATDPDQEFGSGDPYSFWADEGNWSRIQQR